MSNAVVSGLGLVTCIGHDAVSACAAQRAKVVRRAPLEDVVVFDEEELEAPLVGAPVAPLTDGFIQAGAWNQMALACFEDLCRNAGPGSDAADFWSRTALLWAVPDIAFERFMWPEDEVPDLLQSGCMEVLEAMAGVTFAAVKDPFMTAGHTGAVHAIRRAEQLLARSDVERVVVLATDSWLDQLSLKWLLAHDRVASAERPVGLIPGEAASLVMLEQRNVAARRGAPAAAEIAASAIHPPPGAADEEDPSAWRTRAAPAIGRAVAQAVAEVLGRTRAFRGDVLVDLNGEEWRAHVWGHALLHLGSVLEGAREIVPATSWGDIGAASGPAAICLAARAFDRGYAAGDEALVLSVSDSGEVAAALVRRPKPR